MDGEVGEKKTDQRTGIETGFYMKISIRNIICGQIVNFSVKPYLCVPKFISDEKDVSALKKEKEE